MSKFSRNVTKRAATFVGMAGDEPKKAPPPPTVADEEVQNKLEEEKRRMKKRKGYASTILTPSEGVEDGGSALKRRTLLG